MSEPTQRDPPLRASPPRRLIRRRAVKGTTPPSFARPPDVGGPWSLQLARHAGHAGALGARPPGTSCRRAGRSTSGRCAAPPGFEPVTQLEHARLGIITPEMRAWPSARAASHGRAGPRRGRRRAHGDPRQQGPPRLPASTRCASAAPAATKINANMGASPVSSGTDEEVEKLRWAERWGADTVMDLSTGGDLDAHARGDHARTPRVPIGTVPIYSMIIGRRIEDLDERAILDGARAPGAAGRRLLHDPRRRAARAPAAACSERLIGIVSRGGSLLAKWMIAPRQAEPDVRALRRDLRDHAPLRRDLLARRRPAPRRPGRRHRRGAARRARDARRAHRARLAPRRAGDGRGPGPRALRPDRVQHEAPAPALPRRALLRARPARHRHLPRLRPHHELHRRHRGRLPRRGDALLRDARRSTSACPRRTT